MFQSIVISESSANYYLMMNCQPHPELYYLRYYKQKRAPIRHFMFNIVFNLGLQLRESGSYSFFLATLTLIRCLEGINSPVAVAF
jgi:hypothetical protein